MRCPLRFRVFSSDPSMQECQRDCAWLVSDPLGEAMCAVAGSAIAQVAQAVGSAEGFAAPSFEAGGDEE